MQILLWVKEMVTLKGFKLSGVPCTHCLVGTVFYKAWNLNAFQREKHSPVGLGFHHNSWSNTPGISPIFHNVSDS